MDSSLIGKIEKAKRYAEERDRINFISFTVRLRGDHNDHTVTFREGVWQCNCGFFSQRGLCSHTMALERLLKGMLVSTPS